jgi:uracil-DNA glycosylase
MGIDRALFYDATRIAIVPMAFCFPGTGKSGDLPPPRLCADTWRKELLKKFGRIELTLVLGRYAIDWHLGKGNTSITETVRKWRSFGPNLIPMPHPSPRNNLWLRRNGWFEQEVLPVLRVSIQEALIGRSPRSPTPGANKP